VDIADLTRAITDMTVAFAVFRVALGPAADMDCLGVLTAAVIAIAVPRAVSLTAASRIIDRAIDEATRENRRNTRRDGERRERGNRTERRDRADRAERNARRGTKTNARGSPGIAADRSKPTRKHGPAPRCAASRACASRYGPNAKSCRTCAASTTR